MRNIAKLALVSILLLSIGSAFADAVLWEQMQDRAGTLYRQGKHDEAVNMQRKALEEAEKTFGPEDNKTAESMDNLAIYVQAIGKDDEAEELYKKALAILEKNLKPNDRYLAIFMNYVAGFYHRIGKEEEAKKLQERAKKIRAMK